MAAVPLFKLNLMPATKPCAECNSPTYWRRKGQSSRGYCLEHSQPDPAIDFRAELRMTAAVFPELHRLDVRRRRPGEPVVLERRAIPTVTYHGPDPYGRAPAVPVVHRVLRGWALPDDVGPCGRCRGLTTVYGPLGAPLCPTCEERVTDE